MDSFGEEQRAWQRMIENPQVPQECTLLLRSSMRKCSTWAVAEVQTGKDKHKRTWRKSKSVKGARLTGTDIAPLPTSFPPQWIRSPHSSQSCLTHSSYLVFAQHYRLLPYKCVVCSKISTECESWSFILISVINICLSGSRRRAFAGH